MRVGYNAMLLGPKAFGVSRCVAQLGAALRECEGFELVTYARAGAEIGSVTRTAPAWTGPRAFRIAWEQLAMPRHVRNDGVDLLHAPGYLMPLRCPVPTVLNVWDLFALTHARYCTRLNRMCYGLLLPRSIRAATRIIVPSLHVRDELHRRFDLDSERVAVIPPGVDPLFRREPSLEELASLRRRMGLERPFVLFAGNPEPKKNLERLLSAYAVACSNPAFAYELVITNTRGWGHRSDLFADRPGVRTLDYVPPEELPLLFRLAHAIALPSLAEGWGLPVAEAMAVGVPVVCGPVPALLDTDPEAAVCVDPTSIDEIADGLVRVCCDETLRIELRRRGLSATRPLTWRAAAERTREVYREACSA